MNHDLATRYEPSQFEKKIYDFWESGEFFTPVDDPERPHVARIVWRSALAAGTEITGPAVIEEPNSTTLLPPGDRAIIDRHGNIVITLAERP